MAVSFTSQGKVLIHQAQSISQESYHNFTFMANLPSNNFMITEHKTT